MYILKPLADNYRKMCRTTTKKKPIGKYPKVKIFYILVANI